MEPLAELSNFMGLLSDILKIKADIGKYQPLQEFIIDHLGKLKDVTFKVHEHGHIFATKGQSSGYPTFICNIASLYQAPNEIRPEKLKFNIWVGVDAVSNKLTALSAQPKCGTFICLKLLEELSAVKCAFYACDIMDSAGTAAVNKEFFDNARFVIEPSKSGFNDVHTTTVLTDTSSTIFQREFMKEAVTLGFDDSKGMRSLVSKLKEANILEVSAASMSSGFHEPYGQYEHVVEADLFKTAGFCKLLATKLTTTYPHKLFPSNPNTAISRVIDFCQFPGCTITLNGGNQYYCLPHLFIMKERKLKCESCGNILMLPKELNDLKCFGCIYKRR